MGVVIVPIVGHPMSRVQSPGLFNARFRDRGIDAETAAGQTEQLGRFLELWP